MSSFINKFFGFVKDVFAGRKKETQEPDVIHEADNSQAITEPELEAESEIQKDESVHQTETEAETEAETKAETETETEISPQDVQQISLNEPEIMPESEPQESEESESSPETVTSEPESKDEYDYTYISQKIRNIITQHYGYSGFAINDTEGYSRFRAYAKSYEIELPESDSKLRRLIVSSGTLIEGNVYVFSHDDINLMLCEVQRLLDKGECVIYFRDLESFIEDSNLYHNLSDRRAVHEILKDNYDGYIFTGSYMETPSRQKKFHSYMDGLKYVLAKYFPDGFNSDYSLLREYALKENIILSVNDKALKRETEALKEWLYNE